MEFVQLFINLLLNLDVMLVEWVSVYGAWVYLMLFAIIFCETGLVFMAFLPGASLLFTSGALAAATVGGEPVLSVWLLLALLIVATVLGGNMSYVIGQRFGKRMLASERMSRFLKPKYVEETHAFFEKHGGKTISFSRFFPFIRTLAPFLAGVGSMEWRRFTYFNLLGGIAWVLVFVLAGYFFGDLPVIRDNLQFLMIAVVVASVAPGVVHAMWPRKRISSEPPAE